MTPELIEAIARAIGDNVWCSYDEEAGGIDAAAQAALDAIGAAGWVVVPKEPDPIEITWRWRFPHQASGWHTSPGRPGGIDGAILEQIKTPETD